MTRICIFVVLLFGCLSLYGEEPAILQMNVAFEENFNSFKGTLDSLPAGFSVSFDNTNIMVTTEDFLGISTGGETTGGCYAWNIGSGDYALGCQPTATKFTPGFFMVTISNGTMLAVNEISISYDVVCLNNADRSSSLNLDMSLDGSLFGMVEGMSFVSPATQDHPASWVRSSLSCNIRLKEPVGISQRIWLRWNVDDAAGSSSRDEYGIDNLKVVLHCRKGMVIKIY